MRVWRPFNVPFPRTMPIQAPDWVLETPESMSEPGHRPPGEPPHRRGQNAGKLLLYLY